MEAFSLLRYWRSNGGDGSGNANVRTSTASTTATTIVTAVSTQTSETGDEEDDDNDHGPFFDLEFSLPAEEEEERDDEDTKDGDAGNGVDCSEEDEEDSDEEDERELKFTLMSGSSGDSTNDANVSVSPSDDLFFKGSFVPVDQTAESNSKPPQFRVSLMKSATKFRVMMLKFKKSKLNGESSESTESNASGSSNSKEEQKKEDEKPKADQTGESESSGKSMTVKFKIEDVPIVSLFKRHNSSKAPKKRQNDDESVSTSSDEKKFSKEAMQKYLKKVKPLYVRVSKKYGEKLKFSGQLSLPGATKTSLLASPATEELNQSSVAISKKESIPEVSEPPLLTNNAKGILKQGNLPAGLRVVCKHLGKSRSASTAVAAAPPGTISSKRRDDSLLQQQDGIQSAILHCKRSFKASRDSDSDCSSNLSRSASDPAPAYGKCANSSPSDAAEGKETVENNKSEGDK